jgi:hypothetical protein
MTYWTSVQIKTVAPCELFPYPKILFALHIRHFLVMVETEYTVLSQCRRTSRQCPRTLIISDMHCRPAILTIIYHSNLYRRYCSTSHGQWSRSKVEVTLRLTVSQYILVSITLVGLATRYYFLSECCCLKFAPLLPRKCIVYSDASENSTSNKLLIYKTILKPSNLEPRVEAG